MYVCIYVFILNYIHETPCFHPTYINIRLKNSVCIDCKSYMRYLAARFKRGVKTNDTMLQDLVLRFAPITAVCLFVLMVVIKLMMIANVPAKDKVVLFLESFKINQNAITSSTRKKNFYKKSDVINVAIYIIFGLIFILWVVVKLG